MREDEAAEDENQIDGEISPATDPRRSAAAKMVGEETAVIEQNRHRRDPAQRGERRQLPACVGATNGVSPAKRLLASRALFGATISPSAIGEHVPFGAQGLLPSI